LTPVGWEPTQGKTPRFFTLDPAANFLYAANQDTDTIVTFRVNKTTAGSRRPVKPSKSAARSTSFLPAVDG
jgi:6-phosphogluconolactonase (cycloisomerase 2 family)